MRLGAWCEKSKICKRQMSKNLKISESTLYKYLTKDREPTLEIAIRIVEFTKGQVRYKDLLSKKHKQPIVTYREQENDCF